MSRVTKSQQSDQDERVIVEYYYTVMEDRNTKSAKLFSPFVYATAQRRSIYVRRDDSLPDFTVF